MHLNKVRLGRSIIVLAALILGGCCDAWTDGRCWMQPPAGKLGPPPMSISVGRAGGTSQSGVGPGFDVSGAWVETGGAGIGRAGRAADSGVYRERSASSGDVYDPARYGRYRESSASAGSAGEGAHSGSYPETGARSGVGG